MANVDDGPRDVTPGLLLYGNRTWSFLYRDFVTPLIHAGYRVIAPEIIAAVSTAGRVHGEAGTRR